MVQSMVLYHHICQGTVICFCKLFSKTITIHKWHPRLSVECIEAVHRDHMQESPGFGAIIQVQAAVGHNCSRHLYPIVLGTVNPLLTRPPTVFVPWGRLPQLTLRARKVRPIAQLHCYW